MLFIIAWKVTDVFVRLNDMTRNSNNPSCVQKAVLLMLPAAIRTCDTRTVGLAW
jgi:hypothetical protein